jgi:hypothetical protein
MSEWQEVKVERNRQSLTRLTIIAARLPIGRSVASAQPPTRAANAATCNRWVLARASNSRRSPCASAYCPQRGTQRLDLAASR